MYRSLKKPELKKTLTACSLQYKFNRSVARAMRHHTAVMSKMRLQGSLQFFFRILDTSTLLNEVTFTYLDDYKEFEKFDDLHL